MLTGLLGALSRVSRGAVDAALTTSERLTLDALARAGTDLVAYQLYGLNQPALRVSGQEIRLDDGTIRVLVEDETGKVDLNWSDPVLLAGIYRAAGLDGLEPETFAATVVAWRERNRPQAGPTGPTARAGKPRRDGFQSVGELRWLPGIAADDVVALADLVTVHNPQGKIDLDSAPETVLRALPGANPQLVERVLRLRGGPPGRTAEALGGLLTPQQGYITAKSSRGFRIRLEMTTKALSHTTVRVTTVKAPIDQALYYTTSYEEIF